MKRVGAHVSISGGVENAPINAEQIQAKAFALFTKNQRQWEAAPLRDESIAAFTQNCLESGYSSGHILPHDSYLINLGTPEKEMRDKSIRSFIQEMNRCRQLHLKFLNFHPGSHKGLVSETESLRLVAEAVNLALAETEGITALIENTAGQGSSIGYTFEHLAEIIDQVHDQRRVGICFDTAHAFAAGYDLRTENTYSSTMESFQRRIGLEYLKAMHLNDSKSDYASRVDRHQNLGRGKLGWAPFQYIMTDSRWEEIPLILETIDETLWAEEIRQLYSFIGQ